MSAYHTANNQLRTRRILNIENESPTVKTFSFRDKQCAKAEPAQFLMMWIPGVDEIPLSILDANADGTVSVAVKSVGDATEALCSRRTGDVVGIRGPFGNSFSVRTGKILVVGGGTGVAPLLFLTKKIIFEATNLTFVVGARAKEELLFKHELEELCSKRNVIATTEDGSYGLRCMATTPLETLLIKERFDMIYTCGPEKMMRKVFDQAEKSRIPFEASLERLMRCAIGLCGSCVIGKYRVCKDGPVFNAEQIRELKKEFGVSKRDFKGKRISL